MSTDLDSFDSLMLDLNIYQTGEVLCKSETQTDNTCIVFIIFQDSTIWKRTVTKNEKTNNRVALNFFLPNTKRVQCASCGLSGRQTSGGLSEANVSHWIRSGSSDRATWCR